MARFDVYGRFEVECVPDGETWVAWRVGVDGKRERVHDVPFPPGLSEDDLLAHLDDVFHEMGTEGRRITRLDRPAS